MVRIELVELFDNFLLHEGAKSAEIIEAYASLGMRPSAEYMAVLEFTNGGEGFIGQNYLRLYSTKELLAFNQAYQVSRFVPGLIIFGSTGYGEAYAFDTRHTPAKIVKVPFIPLDADLVEPLYADFGAFLHALFEVRASNKSTTRPEINMETVGKEAHQRHPLAHGGNPADPANTVMVPTKDHAEICVFWNDVWQRKKPKTKHS